MPGDIYPVNVSRRPHLICSAPSINHCPCCVPTDAGSEHTQQPAPRALREGAPRLHTQRSTQSFSLLCAGCSSTVGHAVASVPQISLAFPFSLWCSPPYPEERCAIRSNEDYAHLPTRSTPLAICLRHMNPLEILFMWGSHSLFPKPSRVSRSPQAWLFHPITSRKLRSSTAVCASEPWAHCWS